MVSTLLKPATRAIVSVSTADYAAYGLLIHSVRQAVFVDEQAIPAELEIDRYDPVSHHVLAWWEGQAIGTGRLNPEGRIGRVAVTRPFRRRGVGLCLMRKLLEVAQQQRHQEVVLAAQHHAIRFYEKLGFQPEGELFSELGITHIMMRKTLS
jgi:predicted GNAT family N-acyltransferase